MVFFFLFKACIHRLVQRNNVHIISKDIVLAHAHFERIFGGEIEFFSTVLDTNYATENDLNPNKIAK